MTSPSEILSERRGAVHWLTINRPERRNALNEAVMSGLIAALGEAAGDTGVRAIVLTGAGDKAFCGGADMKPGEETLKPNLRELTTPMVDLLRLADRCAVPIIGRINGHCLAGGMGLLGLCDLAVAADSATFGLPEVKVGIFPMQIMLVLRGLVAPRHLNELVLTGDRIEAEAARAIGLVNRVVPSAALDQAVDELVGRVVVNSPLAIRRGKYAMRAIQDMPFEAAASFLESQVPAMIMSDDAREGLASFNEKRAPKWSA